MQTIFEAKKHFAVRYLSEEGFVGVGIGRHENTDVLLVYVESADCTIAQQFKAVYGEMACVQFCHTDRGRIEGWKRVV